MTTVTTNPDLHNKYKKIFSTRKRQEIIAVVWRILLGLLFLSPVLVGLVFSFEPDAAISTLPPVSKLIEDASLNNYNWVLTNDMTYIRSYEHVKADWVWADSWVDDMAASQMDEWGGNCYRYAAFLGMLLREATGLPVTVYYGQTPGLNVDLTYHGWPAICQEDVWYIYDVELDKYTEYDSSGCYKVPASESTLHLQGIGTNLY